MYYISQFCSFLINAQAKVTILSLKVVLVILAGSSNVYAEGGRQRREKEATTKLL